ncbi:hypothetical protein Terro_4107 [Terriglobus roseus DSM 18391]|uniref:Adenylate cyclase n=1 Tax=Terriglobus roseus (strain DSM 18391 / NRRL B-41598 / KBS 63) TaxID=926566 RepID=I3ZM46_TERRK|nr:hypothetical protein [Terriglobus roseus]AFL90314.1 hypothetical protein Terro_4107 [Terriglobus roseus DSM 18391]
MLALDLSKRNHMLPTAHDPHVLLPATPHEAEPVRAQMEKLLHSTHFRNSRRYPTLLRYIVEETLEGRGPHLKERTLGVEVFGRAPDYDTASDPIVRVTVAEIRKRIAQYYHEEAHASEMRIELTPGSYIPEFLPGREAEETARLEEKPAAEITALPLVPSAPEVTVPASRKLRWWIVGLVAAVLLCAGGAFAWQMMRPTPIDVLWQPVFAANGPITFCLPMSVRKNGHGTANTTQEAIAHALDLADTRLPASGTFFDHQLLGENVVYSDVLAMMKLESVVERQHRQVRVRLNLGTTLNDLREGPVIFLGGLDNQWTLQLLEPLRFRFAGSDADLYYIRDATSPASRQWSVRLHDKMTIVNRDYALVARVHSEALGQVVMVAAGIGMSGTAAAGEFLASPESMRELQRQLGPASKDHDFEVVLQTDVVNGIAGAAKIVALDVR